MFKKRVEYDLSNPIELEAALIRQEHRLFNLLHNFFTRKRCEKTDPRRKAAVVALIWRITWAVLPGAAVTGMGIAAIAGIWLSYDSNRLIKEQNETILADSVEANRLLEEQNVTFAKIAVESNLLLREQNESLRKQNDLLLLQAANALKRELVRKSTETAMALVRQLVVPFDVSKVQEVQLSAGSKIDDLHLNVYAASKYPDCKKFADILLSVVVEAQNNMELKFLNDGKAVLMTTESGALNDLKAKLIEAAATIITGDPTEAVNGTK